MATEQVAKTTKGIPSHVKAKAKAAPRTRRLNGLREKTFEELTEDDKDFLLRTLFTNFRMVKPSTE